MKTWYTMCGKKTTSQTCIWSIYFKKVQRLTGADFILLFHQTFLSVDLQVGIVKGRWHNLLSGFQRLSGTATIGFRTSRVTINERIFTQYWQARKEVLAQSKSSNANRDDVKNYLADFFPLRGGGEVVLHPFRQGKKSANNYFWPKNANFSPFDQFLWKN